MNSEEHVYEYKGFKYCDEPLDDDLYKGDLYMLYLELRDDGLAHETTYYFNSDFDENYESAEELIENCFDYLKADDEVNDEPDK